MRRRSYRFLSALKKTAQDQNVKLVLPDLRKRFVELANPSQSTDGLVTTATFQPVRARKNEDRLVHERWNIGGRNWRLLAVMDGHGGGGITSNYAAQILPGRIRAALENLSLDEVTKQPSPVPDLLHDTIVAFDNSLFHDIEDQFSHSSSSSLTTEEILANSTYLIQRALNGCTLTLALIDEEAKSLWVAALGDSTVALSCVEPDGKRTGVQLLEHHVASNPNEYSKVMQAHPDELVFDQDYVWGTLAMTRAIGDFPYKLPLQWSEKLFFHSSTPSSRRYIASIRHYNKTPPYVLSEPSIRHISLKDFTKDQKPLLVLFSDGIDLLVDGIFTYYPVTRRNDTPSSVVGALLGESADPRTEQVLGHPVEIGWEEAEGNKALEVLGNLFAGTNSYRWLRVLNAETENVNRFYVDDTSIIVFDMRTLIE